MVLPTVGPRVLRGSLQTVDPAGKPLRTIAFQFNPDTLTRNLRRRGGQQETDPADAYRVHGAPIETLTLTVELDATDAFPGERFPDIARQLAELELLLYPTSDSVAANDQLLEQGTIEILGEEAPLLLLSWGPRRTVPVRLESVQVTEQAFDPWLCPVRASVELSLQVLSYDDLLPKDPGRTRFRTYHKGLEQVSTETPGSVPSNHTQEKAGLL